MPRDAAAAAGAGGSLTPRRGRPRRDGAIARVGDVLPRVLGRLGLAADLDRWRMVNEWDAIVGAPLAQHARAVRVEGEVLVVEADSSAALFHVKHFETQMLANVQAHLRVGTIRNLRFEVRNG